MPPNNSSYVSWKGQTLGQITTSIKKNKVSESVTGNSMFLPPPLKIYRREISTAPISASSMRTSTSIDEINRPNGYLVVSQTNNCSGNVMVLEKNNPNINNNCCDPNSLLDPASIARRRMRSSGRISKPVSSAASDAPYCTTSQEYLNSRGKTFGQNQFHYFKSGNAVAKPGGPGSEGNKYAVNSNSLHCKNSYVETQFKPTIFTRWRSIIQFTYFSIKL
jgi:hypothetical protein